MNRESGDGSSILEDNLKLHKQSPEQNWASSHWCMLLRMNILHAQFLQRAVWTTVAIGVVMAVAVTGWAAEAPK